MRIVISFFLAAFLVFLGAQIWSFHLRGQSLAADLSNEQAELDRVRQEASAIRSDRDFYSNPVNLEKELRARFNYRGQDENMMVLVPATSTR